MNLSAGLAVTPILNMQMVIPIDSLNEVTCRLACKSIRPQVGIGPKDFGNRLNIQQHFSCSQSIVCGFGWFFTKVASIWIGETFQASAKIGYRVSKSFCNFYCIELLLSKRNWVDQCKVWVFVGKLFRKPFCTWLCRLALSRQTCAELLDPFTRTGSSKGGSTRAVWRFILAATDE